MEEIPRIGSPGVDIQIVPSNFFMNDPFQQSNLSIKNQVYLAYKVEKRFILKIEEVFDYRLVKLYHKSRNRKQFGHRPDNLGQFEQ
jgi:hypothetical protein